MATIQSFLVCDSSTLANFKSWAQAISTALSTFGWTPSSDTGQVNWSTISTVPGSGASVYEIWQPNDGLTNFYLKIQYGNYSGQTNSPCITVTVSTTTNGAGTPTGTVMGPYTLNYGAITSPSTTTTYECDFSGGSGRFNFMLWRNGVNAQQMAFGIERSVNASGAYTGTHVTIVVAGPNGTNLNGAPVFQQSLLFGVGVGPFPTNGNRQQIGGGLYAKVFAASTVSGPTTSAFNNQIPLDTLAPLVGNFDFNLTMFGVAMGADVVEGVAFGFLQYGTSYTFLPSKNGAFAYANPFANIGNGVYTYALCMRYD